MAHQARYPVGTKVEVLAGYNDKMAFVLGEGIYDGVVTPPFLGGMPTEKITLANGDIVYDCETLWGVVGSLKQITDTRTVQNVRVRRDEKGIYRGYFQEGTVPPPLKEKVLPRPATVDAPKKRAQKDADAPNYEADEEPAVKAEVKATVEAEVEKPAPSTKLQSLLERFRNNKK